jgi:cytochrome c5
VAHALLRAVSRLISTPVREPKTLSARDCANCYRAATARESVLLQASSLVLLSLSSAFAQTLPPGKGGEIIDANCGGCHGIGRITGAGGKSKTDWQSTVERMMAKGIDIKPADEEVAVAYLARYFGEEVKVNNASAKDLQEQLDLTESEAEAIVKARTATPIKSLADLAKVPGLDMKKLEAMKGRLVY